MLLRGRKRPPTEPEARKAGRSQSKKPKKTPTKRTRSSLEAPKAKGARSKKPSNRAASTSQPKPITTHSNTIEELTPHLPGKPAATLYGLPTELRLEIYRYLFGSTLVHVQCHRKGRSAPRFSLSMCRSTSTESSLFCANPKWSGMCEDEDRCQDMPQGLSGVWALAASSKFFRQEIHDVMLETYVFAVHPRDLWKWFDHMAKKEERIGCEECNTVDPRHEEYHRSSIGHYLDMLTSGPPFDYKSLHERDDELLKACGISRHDMMYKKVHKLRHLTIAGPIPYAIGRHDMEILRSRAPQLKSLVSQSPGTKWLIDLACSSATVSSRLSRVRTDCFAAQDPSHIGHRTDFASDHQGIQGQDSCYTWTRQSTIASSVDDGAWRNSDLVKLTRAFPPTTTIALEAMIWLKRRSLWNDDGVEKMTRIRILRPGKKAGASIDSGWEDADVVTEVVDTEALAVCTARDTQWKKPWTGKGSGAFF